MRVLVTGAAGALGRTLVRLLEEAGTAVVALDRVATGTLGRGPTGYADADIVTADWMSILPGCNAVYHLAAFVHRQVVNDEDLRLLRRLNVDAVARLAVACRITGVQLVFASSVAAQVSTSEAQAYGLSPYGQSKLDGEAVIRSEGARGLRFAVVRLPLLYGPGGRGNMERMLRAISRHRYWPVGDPTTPKSCLHYRDAAMALELASKGAAIEGKVMTAAPAIIPTLGEIHAAAYDAVGRWAPPHLPVKMARIVAAGADILARGTGRKGDFSNQVRALTAPSGFDGRAFAEATGFRDEVTLLAGLRETARTLGLGGKL